MSESDPVLAALLAAVHTNDHPDLRAALGKHLHAKADYDQALVHLRLALTTKPADIELLSLACEAAEATGQVQAASGYRQLLSALAPTSSTPPPLDDVAYGLPDPNEPDDAELDDPELDDPELDDSEPGDAEPGDAEPDPDEPVSERVASGRNTNFGSGPSSDNDDFDAFLKEVLAEDRADRVRLDDVGGMTQVKAELERRFFLPLRNPEVQKAFGKAVSGGLLLYGPPGCGKTFLARAIAGELDARFIPVTLHDTLDMWMGQSEQNLHSIFSEARSETPTVLFLDEVDAIGQKRSRAANSSMRSVVAQLLNELDGAVDRNDGIFVIAATNAPWDVDPALRRPGRFDRTVLVLPPDSEARMAILELHLRERPTETLDLARVAKRTQNLSGADLKLICDTAVEIAMERSVKSGRIEPVSQKMLDKAARSVKPSVGPWLDTARNFVTFSNADGEYDELQLYLSSQGR